MSIFTKLKTASGFSTSVIKSNFALILAEKSEDGLVSLKCKLDDNSISTLAGDIDEKISTHNSDPSAHPDKPGYPNYSAGVTITSAFNTGDAWTYTFDQSGWLYARCRPGGTFTINGTGTILVSDSGGPYLCTFVPVFTGDVLTGTAAAASLIFYPNR